MAILTEVLKKCFNILQKKIGTTFLCVRYMYGHYSGNSYPKVIKSTDNNFHSFTFINTPLIHVIAYKKGGATICCVSWLWAIASQQLWTTGSHFTQNTTSQKMAHFCFHTFS